MTMIPWGDHRARIDGNSSELLVAEILRSAGTGLSDFRVEEQELVATPDGDYRIDITGWRP
jgi:hypothetical protein